MSAENDRLLQALRADAAQAPIARFRGGAECPDELAIAFLAEQGDGAPEAASLLDHLGRCGHCLVLFDAALAELRDPVAAPAAARDELIRGAADLVPAAEAAPAELPPIRAMRPYALLRWTSLAAAAALLMFWMFGPGGTPAGPTPEQVAALAVVEPLELSAPRDPAEPETFEGRVIIGIDAYLRADYPAAIASLQAALTDRPERDDVRTILASTLLLTGRAPEAIDELTRILETATGPTRADTLWSRAQAHLLTGDAPAADADLAELIALDAGWVEDATALRSQLAELDPAD